MSDAIVESIVEKLYTAFNDPGFLGAGGTDEQGVLNALADAKKKKLMKEVEESYNLKYQEAELSLKDELDDELSGDDFTRAMQLYTDGLNAKSDDVMANTTAPGHVKPIAGTVTPSAAKPGTKPTQNAKDLLVLRNSDGFKRLNQEQQKDVLEMAASYPALVPDLPSMLETNSFVNPRWNGSVIGGETPKGREVRIQFMHIAGVFATWLKDAGAKPPGTPTEGVPLSLQEKILKNTLRFMVSGRVDFAFYSEGDGLMASWDGARINVNVANLKIPTNTKPMPDHRGSIIDTISHEMAHYTNGVHHGHSKKGSCENFLDELSANMVAKYAELGTAATRADISLAADKILRYPQFKDMRLDKTDDDGSNPEKKRIRDLLAELYGVAPNRITRTGDVNPTFTGAEWQEMARYSEQLYKYWDLDNNPDNLETS